ncbi:MAG: TolC family protein [Gemmatales bacterium]|nr:TolC family protein [Gemmatales bacterium]MDW8385404.1 hypothetical protein [Gemmatales bacterium]
MRANFTRRSIPCSPATVLLFSFLLLTVLFATGCTRRFFRHWADREVLQLLESKDQFPQWELRDYYVYPHPLARFADPSDPDHPPMPPDDLPTWMLSTRPQKPKQVAYIEGTGYLQVLQAWDAANRAARKEREERKKREAEQPEQLPPPRDAQGHDKNGSGNVFDYASVGQPTAKILTGEQPTVSENPGPGVTDPSQSIIPVTAAQYGVQRDAANGDSQHPQAYLITLDQAVELALFNSREFQDRRESLYLTALPVTLQRFNFLPQFYATEQVIREWAASRSTIGKQNRWVANTGVGPGSGFGFTQLFSTGALLTLQLANRTVVNLTGDPRHTISESTLILDLSQPLLQAGGRAVTLEPLTQAERDLVYELRNFARFHREFYVAIAVGSPIRTAVGGIGVAGLDLGVRGQAAFVGYYPTIQRLAVVENNRANVESFARLLRFYQAYVVGGSVSQLQVDQIEQQLLDSRAQLLLSEVLYQDSLDQFKLQLGLPTNLPLELDFGPLEPLKDQMERLSRVEADYRQILDALDQLEEEPEVAPQRLRGILERLFVESPLVRGTKFREEIIRRYATWRELASGFELPAQGLADLLSVPLQAPLNLSAVPWGLATGPRRSRAAQRILELQEELDRLEDEEERYADEEKEFPRHLRDRMRELQLEISLGQMELALRNYELKPWEGEMQPQRRRSRYIDAFRRVTTRFAEVMESARAERFVELDGLWPTLPPVYLHGVDLLTADELEAQNLVEQTALINRLDLMNARAQVVDAWRKIAVFANSLLGVANLQYHMEVTTPRNQAQPLTFWGRTAIHRMTLDTELPLVRQLQRNNYRASLIAYQRQRRALQQQEDNVRFQVRQELRTLRQLAQTYAINQRSVRLAYQVLENSLEELRAPPAPGAQRDAASSAAALTQQVVNAQNSVLRAQNSIYATYVNYIRARMELYRDLELLRVDSRGVWIDEYASPAERPDGSQPEPGQR